MKLGAPYVVNGFACLLLAGVVVVACGSDANKVSARDGGGAAGEGGDSFVPAAGGGEMQPELGGNGGELALPSGGMGGEPLGVAGTPQVTLGGEGGTLSLGGAGGAGGEGGSGLPPIDCGTIVFADPNLEEAVRDALAKPTGDITPADVVDLTSLQANGYGVQLLDGIECLSSLTMADFGIGGGASSITNLQPLVYLKDLKVLDLASCPLGDLTPLGQLPSLELLILNNALKGGEDLSPLGSSSSLVTIELQSNQLGDLSGLGQIATLQSVYMQSSTFTNPTSLGELTQIDELHAGNAITDATPLGKLTQLQYLDIGNKAVANLSALSPLVNLTYLDLQTTGATSVAFAVNMLKLETLNLYVNQVSDLTPLQNLPALKTLALNNNPIITLAPLANNLGLATGDTINLTAVALNCTNEANNIKALKDRGVTLLGSGCP